MLLRALYTHIQLTDLLLQDVSTFERDWNADIVLRVEDVAPVETWNKLVEAHGWKGDDDVGDLCRSPEPTARVPREMVV